MTSPASPAAGAAAAGRRKYYFFHGHRRRPSPHRPFVRGGLFTNRTTTSPSPSPSPSSRRQAVPIISFRDWDPSTSPTPAASTTASAVPASDRRLSPLARYVLSTLRRHGRWGPHTIADLSKLRRVVPSLVTEVLRSHPPLPPSLATPFFLWAGKQKNFRHSFSAFHALAASLSAAGLPAAADQVPLLMRSHGKPVSETQLAILIHLHARSRRPLRALHALHLFRDEFGIRPQIFIYNRVLESLVRFNHIDKAVQLLAELRADGLKEEPLTFTILARGLSRSGRTDELLAVLDRMRNEVCRPDVFVYTSVVKAMATRGYMDGCIRVWEEMRNDGVEADAMAYMTMVTGLCKAGMVVKAKELFDEMRRKKKLIDRVVYASLIGGFVAEGHVGDACRLLQEMVDAGYRADLEIYNSLIGGLCSIDRVDKARKMFHIVLQEGLVPSFETVTPLMACYANRCEMAMFFELINKLSELGLPVIDHVAHFFTFFAGKDGQEMKSMEVFEALKGKGYCGVGIYNILVENLLRKNERKKALVLFEEMLGSEDFKPDSCTYSHMIRCFVDEGNVQEACLRYNTMMKMDWIPSISACCSLVKGLCKIGEIDAAISLVKDCLGNIENGPMEFKYALTVLGACKSKTPEKVVKVLDEMIELGYPLENIIFCAIMHGFCKYASSTEARKVFVIMKDRGLLSEANFIVYEDILNEYLKKVTAGLVISGLKFFGLESKLKWASPAD